MNQVLISLGSNIGDKSQNIKNAIKLLKREIGSVIVRSEDYISEPWGFESNNSFINIVIVIETEDAPFIVLKKIKKVEEELGRLKNTNKGYQDRIIDIDIIVYNDLELKTEELTIPHKFAHERNFVVEPVKEILSQISNKCIKISCQQIISKYDSI